MQVEPVIPFRLHRVKMELPQVQIPVGLYGKEDPPRDIEQEEWLEQWKDQLTDSEKNKIKVQRAIQLLGTWWKMHPDCSYVNRGEHFLTIYNREISQRKPDISLVSGKHMLVSKLLLLVQALDPKRMVYVGDLKLMGSVAQPKS